MLLTVSKDLFARIGFDRSCQFLIVRASITCRIIDSTNDSRVIFVATYIVLSL